MKKNIKQILAGFGNRPAINANQYWVHFSSIKQNGELKSPEAGPLCKVGSCKEILIKDRVYGRLKRNDGGFQILFFIHLEDDCNKLLYIKRLKSALTKIDSKSKDHFSYSTLAGEDDMKNKICLEINETSYWGKSRAKLDLFIIISRVMAANYLTIQKVNFNTINKMLSVSSYRIVSRKNFIERFENLNLDNNAAYHKTSGLCEYVANCPEKNL